MVRLAFALVAITFLAPALYADEQLKASVIKLATEMSDAIRKNDYTKVLDSTYPGVVKQMGGRDKALAQIETGMKQLKEQGIVFKDSKLGEPSEFYPEGSNLFVVIPTKNEMAFPKGKLISKSYLLGISSDSGKSWTFVDGAGMANKAAMLKILPKLPAKLVLPAEVEPEIIPNAK